MNKSAVGGDLEGEESVIELQHYPVGRRDIARYDGGGEGSRFQQHIHSNYQRWRKQIF